MSAYAGAEEKRVYAPDVSAERYILRMGAYTEQKNSRAYVPDVSAEQ